MVFEVYNRCGSCKNFRTQYTDRMNRTMGECHGKPNHPMVAAHEFGCPEYHLERDNLLPGSPVPDDADVSPRQREMQRRMQSVQAPSHHRHGEAPARAPRVERRRDDDDELPPKITKIPLQISEDGQENSMDRAALKSILAEVLDEALGLSDTPLHPRFRGGKVMVHPGNPDLQAKEIEIDGLFRKIVSMRDKLRVLEQKINASDKLDSQDKVQIQQYITGCYGSLTSFNFLFKDREDWFVGQ